MRIALLDDEPSETARLSEFLRGAGHTTDLFQDPRLFVKHLHRETFDLIVIDWQMPGMSGLEVLQWIRKAMQSDTPVIFVTNLGGEASIMEGLDNGADDYLTKPVRKGEFLSRVHATLRRAQPATAPKSTETYGPYTFKALESIVRLNDEDIALTPKELNLSLLLFRNADKALSRTYIQQHVWGNDNITTRSMDAHLSRLRTKLRLNDAEQGYHLMPIYNFGYRLVATHATHSV